MSFLRGITLNQVLPWLLIVCGSIGLLMSAIITIEKIYLLENPGAVLGCDINPVVACGSIMQSAQASTFGNIPNPLIGLATYPVLITTGVIMLMKVRFKRWYWIGMQLGTLFGLIFVHWLFYHSLYTISALCPYCVVVWIVTIIAFWYVLIYNLQQKYIRLPARFQNIGGFLQRHHLDILLVWFLLLTGLILNHFWYYYGPLLNL